MKKIGVLTSGGDAPGMNAAIRAVVKTAIANGIQPIGFIKGYNGILEKNYHVMDRESVSGIIHSGGTILKTARCMEFYEACLRSRSAGKRGRTDTGSHRKLHRDRLCG